MRTVGYTTSAATPSRSWSAMRASGSQPPRCSSSKRTPVMRISSGGFPAAATSPSATGREKPSTTQASPLFSMYLIRPAPHGGEEAVPHEGLPVFLVVREARPLPPPLRVDVVDVGVRRLGDVGIG